MSLDLDERDAVLNILPIDRTAARGIFFHSDTLIFMYGCSDHSEWGPTFSGMTANAWAMAYLGAESRVLDYAVGCLT